MSKAENALIIFFVVMIFVVCAVVTKPTGILLILPTVTLVLFCLVLMMQYTYYDMSLHNFTSEARNDEADTHAKY